MLIRLAAAFLSKRSQYCSVLRSFNGSLAVVACATMQHSQCSTSYTPSTLRPARRNNSRGKRSCPSSHRFQTISATVPVFPPLNRSVDSSSQLVDLPSDPGSWGTHSLLMSGCEAGHTLRVAVLLSGGVDSSLSLKLLKSASHICKAFYLQIWFQEDFRNFWDACPWEEDLKYAQQVCHDLGVELELVPLTTQYWDRVVAHCVAEIKQGRTPNPDVLCNSRVKFGAFYEYLLQHHAAEFDRVASGHYARVVRPEGAGTVLDDGAQEVRLALTPDAVKDQTYFLANLSQEQLTRAMFPIGGLTKAQVRTLAAAVNLANQSRKDSQGICFLGKVKFSEFVKEHLGEWPGFLVEVESGRKLGMHQGFWFFTVGQRGGIKLPDGPWYVVRKDIQLNIVYVSKQYYADDKLRNTFVAGPFSWLGRHRPDTQRPLAVKVRHGPHMYGCTLAWRDGPSCTAARPPGTKSSGSDAASSKVTAQPGTSTGAACSSTALQEGSSATSEGGAGSSTALHGLGSGRSNGGELEAAGGHEFATIVLDASDQGLAAGQYAVLYQDGFCLGGATIQSCLD